jgi:urease subunit beta
VIPGEIQVGAGEVELAAGRERLTLRATNTGDRPVQVGSHMPFALANPALQFERARAAGMRLDVPAGTSVRFEPGIEREVTLVRFAGLQLIPGIHAG